MRILLQYKLKTDKIQTTTQYASLALAACHTHTATLGDVSNHKDSGIRSSIFLVIISTQDPTKDSLGQLKEGYYQDHYHGPACYMGQHTQHTSYTTLYLPLTWTHTSHTSYYNYHDQTMLLRVCAGWKQWTRLYKQLVPASLALRAECYCDGVSPYLSRKWTDNGAESEIIGE